MSAPKKATAQASGDASATGIASPRLPLEGATEPHPDGLRIAPGQYTADGTTFLNMFLLCPPAPRTRDDADADALRVRVLVAKAVLDAAKPIAAAAEVDVSELTSIVEYAADAATTMAAAGADALRAALGPPLTDAEDACVQRVRGYLEGYLEGAALRGAEDAAQETRTKKPRPQAPKAVGTYQELVAVAYGAADAKTGANWTPGDGGGLVHGREKDGVHTRYAGAAGAPTADLYAVLKANGGDDTVALAQVLTWLAIEYPRENVSLDELGAMIRLDPRTTKAREAMRRSLWGRIDFLRGLTVWGARSRMYHDPVTRERVRVESRDALFSIGTEWPVEGEPGQADVPRLVSVAPGPGPAPLLGAYRGRPDVLTSWGDFRKLVGIPRGKTWGAWAFSIGLAQNQNWRDRASYGDAAPLTRGHLLRTFAPSPTVDEVLAGPHPERARKAFTQALHELKNAGVIADYSETDLDDLPRYGWAPLWLKHTVAMTAPAPQLEAAAGMQLTRDEVAERAAKKAAAVARRTTKRGS